MNARAICLTSDRGNWLLPGFLHQWDKYSPLPVTVYGFTDPGYASTKGRFVSLGDFRDYPKEKWSDGLLRAIDLAGAERVILLLEDYWLTRAANYRALAVADWCMASWPDVLRFDLTSDRMYAGLCDPGLIDPATRADLLSFQSVDIFESFAPDYRFSYQASLWNAHLLRQVVRPGETPWESELRGNERSRRYRVLATYQWPLRYLIAVNKGAFDRAGAWQVPARTLSASDWAELDLLGYTREAHAALA